MGVLLFMAVLFMGLLSHCALAACPTDVLTGSLDVTNGGCVCDSGFAGYASFGYCTPVDISRACPGGQLPQPSQVTTNLAGMDLTTVNMTGYDTLVRFSIQMPMMAGRKYTQIGVTGPNLDEVQYGCTADKLFASFSNSGASSTLGADGSVSGCGENWNVTAEFDQLRACGFEVSGANDLSSGFQLFDGAIRVRFMEPVLVGTGAYVQAFNRTVTVDYPFRIAFDSNYVVPMTVNDVTVYSKQQVDFAISGQNIPKDPNQNSPATATITYTIQYPYAVIAWNFVTTDAPITASVTPMYPSKICVKDRDYIASDNATMSTCRKSDNTLVFSTPANTPETCKFTAYKYTLPYATWCGAGIAATDCPIAAPDINGTVTFSITTENFCTQLAEMDRINNVITITEFKAYSPIDYATQQNAWVYGTDMFMRMDFAGLPLKTCHLTKLQRAYLPNPTNETVPDGYWVEVGAPGVVDPRNASQTTSIVLTGFSDEGPVYSPIPIAYNANGNNGAGANNNGVFYNYLGDLGLSEQGDQYRFKLRLIPELLGNYGDYTVPARGADWFLKLRATIDVTYDRAIGAVRMMGPSTNAKVADITDSQSESGRVLRRRRQAMVSSSVNSGGSGVKESEIQRIQAPQDGSFGAPAETADTPNSAHAARAPGVTGSFAAMVASFLALAALAL